MEAGFTVNISTEHYQFQSMQINVVIQLLNFEKLLTKNVDSKNGERKCTVFYRGPAWYIEARTVYRGFTVILKLCI